MIQYYDSSVLYVYMYDVHVHVRGANEKTLIAPPPPITFP